MRLDSPIGGDLVELHHQMEGLPNQALQQYVQTKDPIKSLAALTVLSRRAYMQQASQAQGNNNPPTVKDTTLQQLGLGSLAPQGAPMPPPQMAAAPQPQGQPQMLAKGGAIAFSSRGDVPYTDVQSEQSMIRQLEEARSRALATGDQSAVAAIDARISSLSGGRYSPPAGEAPMGQPAEQQAPRTMQDLYKFATTELPEVKSLQEALDAHRNYLANRQPAGLSEESRNRMVEEQFQKNQAALKPYYDKQEGLLSEERKAAVNTNLGSDAWMRFGLGMMGGRGNLASIMSQAGLGALDYYEKAKQAEAAALRESRKGEMLLLQSRRADERGDRTAAQAFADRADQSAIRQQQLEDNAKEALLQTQGKSAGIASSKQKNTTDEFARMITAEENRDAANKRAADALQERKDRFKIAGMTAPRTTDFREQLNILAGPYIRDGVPRDQAMEKAYKDYLGGRNQAATQRYSLAVAKQINEKVDAALVRDPAYKLARSKSDLAAMEARRAEVTQSVEKQFPPADGSTAPATGGAKFLGFE